MFFRFSECFTAGQAMFMHQHLDMMTSLKGKVSFGAELAFKGTSTRLPLCLKKKVWGLGV